MVKSSRHFKTNVDSLRSQIRDGALHGLEQVAWRIVDQTPVDTKASRGNWQAVKTLEQTQPFSPTKANPSIHASLERILQTNNMASAGGRNAVQELYLVNPTPYALEWELGRYPRESPKVTFDGFSRQAPEGVVIVFEKQDSVTLANAVKHILEKY